MGKEWIIRIICQTNYSSIYSRLKCEGLCSLALDSYDSVHYYVRTDICLNHCLG